jgi:hypothetical protein
LLATSQYYLCAAKVRAHRIRRGILRGEGTDTSGSSRIKSKLYGKRNKDASREKQGEHFDDLFEARLARVELWVMLLVFVLEDVPGLIFTTIVKTATGIPYAL